MKVTGYPTFDRLPVIRHVKGILMLYRVLYRGTVIWGISDFEKMRTNPMFSIDLFRAKLMFTGMTEETLPRIIPFTYANNSFKYNLEDHNLQLSITDKERIVELVFTSVYEILESCDGIIWFCTCGCEKVSMTIVSEDIKNQAQLEANSTGQKRYIIADPFGILHVYPSSRGYQDKVVRVVFPERKEEKQDVIDAQE
jgi:hypothetical protein